MIKNTNKKKLYNCLLIKELASFHAQSAQQSKAEMTQIARLTAYYNYVTKKKEKKKSIKFAFYSY